MSVAPLRTDLSCPSRPRASTSASRSMSIASIGTPNICAFVAIPAVTQPASAERSTSTGFGAPNPVEVLLSALAGCVTAGIATNAQMFGVPIDAIDIDLEADVDARGLLGHDKSVRNGATDIRYTVTIQSSAPEDQVRRCKETIDRKSPVRDTLANPVNIVSTLVYKPR